MVDVNRIRARAADWLGDAGDAALRAVARRVRGSRIPDEVMRAWRERGTRPGEVPSAIIGAPALPDEDEDAATDPSVEPASGGPGPWRGLVHEVRECRVLASTWRAEAVGPDGQVYTALFMEPDAEARAREYAALMSAPLPCTPVLLVGQDRAADNGVWCDRHGGRPVGAAWGPVAERQFAPASQFSIGEAAKLEATGWTPGIVWYHDDPCGTWHENDADDLAHLRASAAPAVASDVAPVDGIEAWIGQPSRDLAAAWNKHAGINAKPAFVIAGQRWNCVGVDGALEVVSATGAARTGDVGLAPVGSVEVTVRAREVDMLGLKEWLFLG